MKAVAKCTPAVEGSISAYGQRPDVIYIHQAVSLSESRVASVEGGFPTVTLVARTKSKIQRPLIDRSRLFMSDLEEIEGSDLRKQLGGAG
jgi:hypothetical protein